MLYTSASPQGESFALRAPLTKQFGKTFWFSQKVEDGVLLASGGTGQEYAEYTSRNAQDNPKTKNDQAQNVWSVSVGKLHSKLKQGDLQTQPADTFKTTIAK